MADGTRTNKRNRVDPKLLLWTIDGNMGYRFQYSAAVHTFTEYSAGFEDMLKSFSFSEHRGLRKPTCLLFNLTCL